MSDSLRICYTGLPYELRLLYPAFYYAIVATRVIASITSCKQCGGQLSRKDPNYLSTNSEHDTFQVYSPIKEATMRQDKTVQYQHICDTYSAISTKYATRTVQYQHICDTYSATLLHMRHVQCNTAPYATRTAQHRSICDTYSATPLHMRHVQCNTAPYATRTVQHRSICDTYSATPLHMRHVQCNINSYATRTVQLRSICDTYSALTPIHAICDT